jgi:hypothetical protein
MLSAPVLGGVASEVILQKSPGDLHEVKQHFWMLQSPSPGDLAGQLTLLLKQDSPKPTRGRVLRAFEDDKLHIRGRGSEHFPGKLIGEKEVPHSKTTIDGDRQ